MPVRTITINRAPVQRGERFWVEVLGRPVPATNTEDGIRAVRGRNSIDPDSVRRYLEGKFGDDLKAVL